MAFQYLYTSARRGLEPGKSGFCCVARDRQLPVDLARELDRLSRYDHISRRSNPIILRHMAVAVRSGNYHVLSRLRDAGADYSKRNNHIAHHLIVEAKDAATLPDPATILLFWKGWKDAWLEPPRVLGERDRFDIHDLATPTDVSTTDFETLVQGESISKTPLLIEEGQEFELALHYRNELLKLPPTDRWSVAFTNFILASDRPTDFSWLANWRGRDLPFELAAPGDSGPSPPREEGDNAAPTKAAAAPATASAQFARNAPTVEIPEELTRKSRRRPKRKWTRKRFSTTLNLGIAAVAAICVGVIAYLAYNYKRPSPPPDQNSFEAQPPRVVNQAAAVRDAETQWNEWVAQGQLLENVDQALPLAKALQAQGNANALPIVDLLALVAQRSEAAIPVPNTLTADSDGVWTFHSPLAGELAGLRFALAPRSLTNALDSLEGYPTIRVYEQLLAHSFQAEDAILGLSSLRRHAKDRISALDLEAVAAAREYRTLWRNLVDEGRLDSLRQLEAAFEINALAAFFAIDDDGMLMDSNENNITEHLVSLYERFLMPRFSSFGNNPEFRQALRSTSQEFESPIEAARAINAVFATAQAESPPLQSRLDRIRDAWQATFIRDDLMEETMIQFSFEGLASSKAELATLQSRFNRETLQELERSEAALAAIDAAEIDLGNLDRNTEWLLVPLGID